MGQRDFRHSAGELQQLETHLHVRRFLCRYSVASHSLTAPRPWCITWPARIRFHAKIRGFKRAALSPWIALSCTHVTAHRSVMNAHFRYPLTPTRCAHPDILAPMKSQGLCRRASASSPSSRICASFSVFASLATPRRGVWSLCDLCSFILQIMFFLHPSNSRCPL